MVHKMRTTHYRKKDLLERGWTPTMIARHLGEPDLTSPWNYNRICWYDKTRVHDTEQREEVREKMTETARRKEAWAAGAEEREEARQRKLEEQKDGDIAWLKAKVARAVDLDVVESDELERRAAKTRYGKFAAKEKGLVAFVRHNLSNYDGLLRSLAGGERYWRYAVIKIMVLGAIAKGYPTLAGECEEQIKCLQEQLQQGGKPEVLG